MSDPRATAAVITVRPTTAESAGKTTRRLGHVTGLRQVADAVSAYLPLVVMGLLALGTWWLVKNTPLADALHTALPLRHEPDYAMTHFTLQRFSADGHLRTQLSGAALRHFPDTDTLEIEQPTIRSTPVEGGMTLASAQRAVSNGDASEVQLLGSARVLRQPPSAPAAGAASAVALEFRGEFLQAFLDTERLHSHLPVTVTRGNTQLRADTLDYDHLERVLRLNGRVRASFAAPLHSSPTVRAGT